MKRSFVFLFFIAGLAVLFFACEKQDSLSQFADEEAVLKSAQIALTDNKLETVLSEVTYESDFYSGIVKLLSKGHHGGMKFGFRDFGHYKSGKGPDVVISNTTDTYPKTITLDYGDSTVIHHGRVLKGVVTIEISAPARTDGSTRKMTFKNFVIDSIAVNGTSISVFKGDNKTSAVENYTEDVVFNYDNGTEVTWKGEKKRDWVEGLSTDTVRSDDVIKITGKANAAITGGSVYLKEITVPLVRKGSCKYITEGVIQLTVDNKLVSSVDYGTGECDASATLTKDGTTTTLDLTKKEPPHKKK
jgi:hypothetical protein